MGHRQGIRGALPFYMHKGKEVVITNRADKRNILTCTLFVYAYNRKDLHTLKLKLSL